MRHRAALMRSKVLLSGLPKPDHSMRHLRAKSLMRQRNQKDQPALAYGFIKRMIQVSASFGGIRWILTVCGPKQNVFQQKVLRSALSCSESLLRGAFSTTRISIAPWLWIIFSGPQQVQVISRWLTLLKMAWSTLNFWK